MQAQRPQHIPTVKWAMTPFPWFIPLRDPVERALELMREHEIRHLPVTDEHGLVGIVTERDIALAMNLRGPEGAGLSVEDVCVADPYVVEITERLDKVLLEMAQRRIGSALVVRQGRLSGIFTATDACRAFGEFLRTMFPDDPGGEAA